MKKSMRNHNLLPFTLMEFLTMIAIIAVLSAMLLPALDKARECARTINCITNQKQLAQGTLDYADDHNGKGIYTKVFLC